MFDCGEGTQRQLMHSSLSTGSVTRIFVTHLHGDHVYGLPGLICGLGAAHNDGNPPVEIYGPPGLRNMLHELLKVTTTRYTRMKHAQRVQVHELHPKHAAEVPASLRFYHVTPTVLHRTRHAFSARISTCNNSKVKRRAGC